MTSSSNEPPSRHSALSPWVRLYVYGLHGYFTEVMFTAAWEFVVNQNWKFPGCTSVWSLLIYAMSVYVIEHLYLRLRNTVPLIARGFLYVLWTYFFEFSSGYLLRLFDACPWDYTLFTWNVWGLITLEYAPLWYLACILTEQALIKNILELQWQEPTAKATPSLSSRSKRNGGRIQPRKKA